MARSEARITVDIWAEESDFTGLSADAQWMYFFLLSQPDLAHTGLLALRERRWSRAAAGLTVQQIEDRLAELEQARYVVIDPSTEELLVRSFIRRDKVYRQPNVLRNAADQLHLIVSPALRMALAVELRRVSTEPMPEGSVAILAEMLEALPEPSGNPSEDPTRTTPGERGVVTAVSTGFPDPRSSEPRTPDPAPPAPPSARADTPLTDTQRSKRITDAYAAVEPMCRWPAVNGIVLKAIRSRRYADTEIEAGLLRLAKEGRGVTVETLRVELDGLPAGRVAPRPSTTDARVTAGLALAQRYDAEDHATPKEIAG